MKNYSKKIQERIRDAEEGTLFIGADFTDIADAETVRRNLNRLTHTGVLRRILQGVFEKPRFNTFLGEYIAIHPDAVARTIARNYHWSIAPCGNSALNALGLSSQVPSIWTYCSDGPYREYSFGNTTIQFKHRTNKEITGLSSMTVLVIQALKTLGKEYITQDLLHTLEAKLTESEKDALLVEAKESTDWIYRTIQSMCMTDRVSDEKRSETLE
ncbi:MAG: DUF6088 family protein [Spirochaetota bacterium]|jgi:predicted transcriptional regulator of viral defense system|uniref:DUF6088 family protein n=1 Tax=Sphaerochaeta associata TaxID=1129264 RepID=UPI00288F8CBE|nr:DUF6088 family protein [Sphaerochaeta associata]MDT3359116.1 DUF6088 family protein [Spirochaetota bacterium]MEA5106835.1 DUF6088 family protein [Sphaerochaeta associata]